MKQRKVMKASDVALGVVLLLILGALTLIPMPQDSSIGLAAEATATAMPSLTLAPALTWENVSLDQIHFGEPKVVLTSTLRLRIVGWISDAEVLILRDTQPGGRGSAIEVFNVESGEVRRLVEGNIWGKPIWSPGANAIAYLMYDERKEVEDLVWQPIEGEARSLRSGVVQPVVLVTGGKGAAAYNVQMGKLVGKATTLSEEQVELAFAPFAPPGPLSVCAWKYDTAVSPDGKWQVVYNCEHFLLVNSETETINELDLGTEVMERAFPRWALDAQWSPDGQQLAIASTFGDFLPRITQLLVFDPWRGKVREIERPPGIIFSEVDWGPEGRYLLVSGLETKGEGTFLPRMWLVDIGGRIRDLDLPVARSEDPRGGTAWSPDGKSLLFYCRPTSASESVLCLSSVEVER